MWVPVNYENKPPEQSRYVKIIHQTRHPSTRASSRALSFARRMGWEWCRHWKARRLLKLAHSNKSLSCPIWTAQPANVAVILSSMTDRTGLVSTRFKHLEINNSKHRSDEPSRAQPPYHVRHDPLEQRRCQNAAETQRCFSCAVWYQRRVLDTRRANGIAVPVGTTWVNKCTYK